MFYLQSVKYDVSVFNLWGKWQCRVPKVLVNNVRKCDLRRSHEVHISLDEKRKQEIRSGISDAGFRGADGNAIIVDAMLALIFEKGANLRLKETTRSPDDRAGIGA